MKLGMTINLTSQELANIIHNHFLDTNLYSDGEYTKMIISPSRISNGDGHFTYTYKIEAFGGAEKKDIPKSKPGENKMRMIELGEEEE